MRRQGRLADDRHRCVDWLVVAVIVQHLQVRRFDAAVGAVDHRGIDAVGACGGRADEGRRLTAGEHDHLIGSQGESVRLLERAQRAGIGELRRTGEHHPAAAGHPAAEIAHGPQMIGVGHIATNRQRPGVAGVGGCQPDDVVGRVVEPCPELVALAQVLPCRIRGVIEEEAGVAGVLNVQVDLAGQQRAAHHRRRPERHPIDRGNAIRIEQQPDHLPDHCRLARQFRGHDHSPRGRRARRCGE